MRFNSFEEIIAWQKARILSVSIYMIFANSKDFAFKDQIQRAVISISNNIAEGYERQTNREFRNYLFIAKGSCAEVRSMLHIASDLQLLDRDVYLTLVEETREIGKILSGLIKSLS